IGVGGLVPERDGARRRAHARPDVRRIERVVGGAGEQKLFGARSIDFQFERRIRQRRVEHDRMFAALFRLLPLLFEEQWGTGNAGRAAPAGRRRGCLGERSSAENQDRQCGNDQSSFHNHLSGGSRKQDPPYGCIPRVQSLKPKAYGNANTNTLAAVLGCNSGVMRPADPATSDEPVVTATYCLPPTAKVIG